MKYILFVCIIIFSYIPSLFAQDITVGVIERAPFSYQENGKWTGFSIDIWNSIAKKNGYNTLYQSYTDFSQMIDDTQQSEVDVSVANISVTLQREEKMDFSYPIYDSGLSMIVKKKEDISVFSTMLHDRVILLLGALLLVYLFAGIYLCAIKKSKNQKIYLIIGIIYFLVCIVYVNFSKITIQSEILKNKSTLQSYSDIQHEKIGITKGSTSEKFIQKNNIENVVTFRNIDDIYANLSNGNIDIMIHDLPILEYYIKHDSSERFKFIGNVFQKEKYAIALPDESILKEDINRAILEMLSTDEYEEIYNLYF